MTAAPDLRCICGRPPYAALDHDPWCPCRGRRIQAAQHNGMLPKGVDKHPAADCRLEWCGLEPVPAQTVENLAAELRVDTTEDAQPRTTIRSQDEFLTALDELLDDTLHEDDCHINPDGTYCSCVISKIRAVLPPCGAVRFHRVPDSAAFGGETQRAWKCLRTAHPASPDLHYFG